MKRNADLSLTLPDEKNVNRLRVPEFAAVRIALVAGAAVSRCHRPAGAPPPKEEDKGTDDFHFVPEKETVEIHYELDDPVAAIGSARIELFCRFREAPLWSLDLAKLGEDWLAHGKHVVKWDGRVVTPKAEQAGTADAAKGMQHDLTALEPDLAAHASFRDGYVTLEHPPYKLKLTVQSPAGRGRPEVVWTHFQILVAGIELELGPEEAISATTVGDARHKRDKAVRKDIEDAGGLPATGATRKVHLRSNLYKTDSAEMSNNAGYTVYRGLWGDGPNIPIVAKVRLKDSAGATVKLEDGPGAKALGKTKFLWEWADVAEVTSSQHAAAKTFLDDALNFDRNLTRPKGDNCHLERGGKRGPSATAVFPKKSGYAPQDTLLDGKFPFEVKPCERRKWSALSLGWTSGALKGRTGAMFQPSRMAGDAYSVTVHLANDRRLDSADGKEKLVLDATTPATIQADAAVKASTGTFQIWRRIHVAKYLKKRSTVTPNINLGTVADYYEKAYVELVNLAGTPGTMVKKTYNDAMTAAVGAQPWYVRNAVSGNDQYDAGGHFIDYVNHATWKGRTDVAATAVGWTNVQKLAWAAGLSNSAGSDPYTNSAVYYQFLYDWALGLIETVCGTFMGTTHGIDIFQFHNLFNPALPRGTDLNGFAANPPGSGRNVCGFIQCGSNYGGTLASGAANLNRREQTCTHEIGHQLFLPHTWQVAVAHDPEGSHDKNDNACTMSYEFDKTRRFCGLCLLRLRGWSKFKTGASGSVAAPAVRTVTDTGPNKRP